MRMVSLLGEWDDLDVTRRPSQVSLEKNGQIRLTKLPAYLVYLFLNL